ncbi:ABC transporter permease [Sulfobacillus harzensis]|uniref:ABC transporter permease subunit n=1 Tax=Sulfobacillus harzensis TaxID=2729629 RepID=A0A7Y0Q2E1_9FIRM|nr:ABC transporter permease subunit [Sulfobacillus harzensis]NMP22397.1 ABC transporter permease subunit [Sulfobacillus harzensis]
MWTCVKWEARRLARQSRFWGSLVAVAVLGGLFSYGYRLMHGQAFVVPTVGRGLANGFFVPILALTLSSSVLLPFFVALVAGDSVAGERQSGTWNTLLTQGISPWRLFWGKALVSFGYAALATLILCASSLAGGWVIFGLHGSALPSGVVASTGQFWRLIVIVWGYATVSQMVVAAFALLVSAFSRHSVSSLLVSMGTLIVLAMLGDMPILAAVRRLLFTSYFSRLGDTLTFPPNWIALTHGLLVYGLYLILFLAAILWFQPFRD